MGYIYNAKIIGYTDALNSSSISVLTVCNTLDRVIDFDDAKYGGNICDPKFKTCVLIRFRDRKKKHRKKFGGLFFKHGILFDDKFCIVIDAKRLHYNYDKYGKNPMIITLEEMSDFFYNIVAAEFGSWLK